jgi:hypothetical protein
MGAAEWWLLACLLGGALLAYAAIIQKRSDP